VGGGETSHGEENIFLECANAPIPSPENDEPSASFTSCKPTFELVFNLKVGMSVLLIKHVISDKTNTTNCMCNFLVRCILNIDSVYMFPKSKVFDSTDVLVLKV